MAVEAASATAVASPAAKTVVLTLPAHPMAPPNGTAALIIRGMMNITSDADSTAIVLTCYAGSASGTIIGAALTDSVAAAGATANIPFSFIDKNFGNTQLGYVITVTETTGGNNGVVNYIEAEMDVVVI